MRRVRVCIVFAVAFVLSVPMFCWQAPAEQPDWPEWLKKTKKPNEYVDWGYDLRIRNERFPDAILRNPFVASPLTEWWRIRQRFFVNVKPTDDLKLKLRIVNESRPIESPDHYTSANPYDRYDHWDETIIDNLYLEYKSDGNIPARYRIGRQDMLAIPGMTGPMGEGFGSGLIFMDGTPGDGSRSFFFDAIRGTYDLNAWIPKSSLDLIYINNNTYSTDHIDVIGGYDDHRRMDFWDTEAYVAYFKNASWIPNTQWDLYYIYKIQEQLIREPWENSTRPGSNINTLGVRYDGKLRNDVGYELEGAWQWGAYDFNESQALATQEGLWKTFPGKCKPKLTLYHAYLSGDDPDTNDYEAWQSIYGDWPKWGECIGYMGPTEDGIYHFTNMHIAALQLDFVPRENWVVTGIMQALWADENTYRGRAGFSDDGKYRGLNPQAVITWKPTKYLSTHFRYEWFVPGDYMDYPADERTYHFVRGEVALTF